MTGKTGGSGPSDADRRDPEDRGEPGSPTRREGREEEDRVYGLLVEAVGSILRQSPEARAAFDAMREGGRTEEGAREEIARVLLAVTFHVGQESERLRAAGGAAGLRSEAFRRLAGGETAADIFGA